MQSTNSVLFEKYTYYVLHIIPSLCLVVIGMNGLHDIRQMYNMQVVVDGFYSELYE